MENKPLISVIIPVYKVEGYLDRCLQSVTGQTYENLEILLVDDGSPDRSGAICDEWAARDSRIKVFHVPNGGAGKARNLALDAARGEFVALVDSDDYLHPNMYMHLYSLMQDDVDIAECESEQTRSDDISMEDGRNAAVDFFSATQAMKLHIRDELFCQVIWNKLYRRSVVADVRFPERKLIDDEFWTFRVLGNARELAHSSARMYAYRQQPESVMHKPFSLRRLQGLEAKAQRLTYIREHFPELVCTAQSDLLFSCIISMQQCLRYLKGEEQDIGKQKVRNAAALAIPLQPDPEMPRKRTLLLKVGERSLEGTARVLNFLMDIHVLK